MKHLKWTRNSRTTGKLLSLLHLPSIPHAGTGTYVIIEDLSK